jgi:hypothetical protein
LYRSIRQFAAVELQSLCRIGPQHAVQVEHRRLVAELRERLAKIGADQI